MKLLHDLVQKELLAKNWNAELLIQKQDLTSVEIEDDLLAVMHDGRFIPNHDTTGLLDVLQQYIEGSVCALKKEIMHEYTPVYTK